MKSKNYRNWSAKPGKGNEGFSNGRICTKERYSMQLC